MRYDLIIKLQTEKDLTPWGIGEEILSCFFSEKKLAPQIVSTFSEVRSDNGIKVDSISACRNSWALKNKIIAMGAEHTFSEDFHWKRTTSIKSQGVVTFSHKNTKGKQSTSTVQIMAKYQKGLNWRDLFAKLCEITSPEFGILHPFSSEIRPEKLSKDVRDYSVEEEIEWQAWSRFLSGDIYCNFRAGEMNSLISAYTNLGWASWVGKASLSEDELSRISESGFTTLNYSAGTLITVTDNIDDAIDNFDEFSARRKILKNACGVKHFLIPD